jgi:hypothetical protein
MSADPKAVEHARAIVAATRAKGVTAKVIGGVGCFLHNVEHGPEASAFARDYGDVDLVMSRKSALAGGKVLEELGYKPVASFNSVQGEVRLMYVAPEARLRIDIFRGAFDMCHSVPLEKAAFRPEAHPALNLVELLLTKLQVVECTQKDLHDLASLFAFHPIGGGDDDIDGKRFAGILGRDWGLWRTVTANLEKVERAAERAPERRELIAERARELHAMAVDAPKSARWKARAIVGERVRWFEEPEEPEVEMDTAVR